MRVRTIPAAVGALAMMGHGAPSWAACDTTGPATGQTATCTAASPNPSSATVWALPGSTNVTVNIEPGAGLHVVGDNGVVVRDLSSVNNRGTITIDGDFVDAITAPGNTGPGHNLLVNRGTILTSGAGSEGIFNAGAAGTLINEASGIVSTTGNGSSAMLDFRSAGGGQLINRGLLTTAGPGAPGMAATAPNDLLRNDGRIVTTADGSPGILANGAGVVVENNGSVRTEGAAAHGIAIGADGPARLVNTGTVTSLHGSAIDISGNNANAIVNAGGLSGGNGIAIRIEGGDNQLDLRSGTVTGDIVTGAGIDTLRWSGAAVQGAIRLGGGDDMALLANLNDTVAAGLTVLDGGTGRNTLVFDATRVGGVARFTGFDTVRLVNGSALSVDGALALGNGAGGPLRLVVDPASALVAAGSAASPAVIRAAMPGVPVTVENAGTIDLTARNAPAGNALTIAGHYAGQGGRLLLRAVLAQDDAPADRLVIAQGNASGNTVIAVTNAGGAGAQTTRNGIPVVLARDGGTTSPGAFTLAGGSVAAGAYVYYLFRGGADPGTADNWYLRSSLAPSAAPVPSPDTPALPPPPPAGMPPVLLYRLEVPLYAMAAAAARELGLHQLGRFHERQGQPSWLTGDRPLDATWVRTWGGHTDQARRGDASPRFDGVMAGMQVGQELYARTTAGGHRDHLGIWLGYARASGDASGLALGFADRHAGRIVVDAYTAGAYWTHLGPGGWYVDAVAQGGPLTVSARSDNGIGATTRGHAFVASLEAGLPLALSDRWVLEPNVQAAWQRLSGGDLRDAVSEASIEPGDAWMTRAGVRAQTRVVFRGVSWEPYLGFDFVHVAGGNDRIVFAGTTAIGTRTGGTAAAVSLGLGGKLGTRFGLHAFAAYATNLDAARRNAVYGGLAVRWAW